MGAQSEEMAPHALLGDEGVLDRGGAEKGSPKLWLE